MCSDGYDYLATSPCTRLIFSLLSYWSIVTGSRVARETPAVFLHALQHVGKLGPRVRHPCPTGPNDIGNVRGSVSKDLRPQSLDEHPYAYAAGVGLRGPRNFSRKHFPGHDGEAVHVAGVGASFGI